MVKFDCNWFSYYYSLFFRGGGSIFQSIWLTDVICLSTALCITQCQSCPTSDVSTCFHFEDITLDCGMPAKICISNSYLVEI